MWDTISFFIGILFGMIIMMLLCWGAFSTRTFIFTGCVKDEIQCRKTDYYNNPSNAISEDGANPNDILYLEGRGDSSKLMYRRVPKTRCRPGPQQDIHIFHPQFCQFKIRNGNGGDVATVKGENHFFESPYYTISNGNDEKINILTSKDCDPISNDGNVNVISGTPTTEWVGYN